MRIIVVDEHVLIRESLLGVLSSGTLGLLPKIAWREVMVSALNLALSGAEPLAPG